jgi:hypothetical protein
MLGLLGWGIRSSKPLYSHRIIIKGTEAYIRTDRDSNRVFERCMKVLVATCIQYGIELYGAGFFLNG